MLSINFGLKNLVVFWVLLFLYWGWNSWQNLWLLLNNFGLKNILVFWIFLFLFLGWNSFGQKLWWLLNNFGFKYLVVFWILLNIYWGWYSCDYICTVLTHDFTHLFENSCLRGILEKSVTLNLLLFLYFFWFFIYFWYVIICLFFNRIRIIGFLTSLCLIKETRYVR